MLLSEHVCAALALPKYHPDCREISQFVRRCNTERLDYVLERMKSVRNGALKRQKRGQSLKEFESAALDTNQVWSILRSFYNEEMANSAQIFIVISLFEDAARQIVNENYTQAFGENWFKDTRLLTDALSDRIEPNASSRNLDRFSGYINDRMSRHSDRSENGPAFLSQLDLMDICLLIYNDTGWSTCSFEKTFSSRYNDEIEGDLSTLQQNDVYEKLAVLRNRRNAICHHKLIPKHYTIKPRGSFLPPHRSDGGLKNTKERSFEICRYFGIRPKLALERVMLRLRPMG